MRWGCTPPHKITFLPCPRGRLRLLPSLWDAPKMMGVFQPIGKKNETAIMQIPSPLLHSDEPSKINRVITRYRPTARQFAAGTAFFRFLRGAARTTRPQNGPFPPPRPVGTSESRQTFQHLHNRAGNRTPLVGAVEQSLCYFGMRDCRLEF